MAHTLETPWPLSISAFSSFSYSSLILDMIDTRLLWIELCPQTKCWSPCHLWMKTSLEMRTLKWNLLKMRLWWIRVDLEWNDPCPFKETERERRKDTDTHRAKMAIWRGLQNWSDAATSWGMPRVVFDNQQLEETKKHSSPECLEEAWPCWWLDFKVVATCIVTKHIYVILSYSLLLLCYRVPRKLIQWLCPWMSL